MSMLSEDRPAPGGPRTGLVMLSIAALVALAAGGYVFARRGRAPVAEPKTTAPGPVAASPTVPPRPTPRDTGVVEIGAPDEATVLVDGRRLGTGDGRVELGAGPHQVRVEQPGRDPFVREVQVIPGRTVRIEARLDAPSPVLRIGADVPGAQAFVDRRFVGETPVSVHDLPPGRYQINVSAEGYEGQSRTVVVGPGVNEVTVRLKEVRLDESLAVTHKHGLGSCRGRLVATIDGLAYESENAKDAFFLPYAQLQPLEVDYMKKNLRVKQVGGRTWNFTADGADALLVFQKDVEKARDRLRDGG